MKNLPSEILGEIFRYLHPEHKVNCMLVCQHWKQVMENFALYYALEICSKRSLNKMTAMLKENPDIGKKVEHLSLFLYDETYDYDPGELLLLLPNIRTLLCTGPNLDQLITEENIVYPWNEHIEYIGENSLCSITYSLLLSNTCPNLTTIDLVDLRDDHMYLLKNAPALTDFTLRAFGSISFDDLDAIHESAPHLKSFTVRFQNFHNSELSQKVNPAISVTDCYFHGVDEAAVSLEVKINLLVYASTKYPNLSKFKYAFSPDFLNDNRIRKLTDSDWFSLFQNLGPQLKKLSICNHGWDGNTFGILDKFNCQIECFEICSLSSAALMKIVESPQIFYIQTLYLDGICFESYSWLKELQTLKKLKVSFSPYDGCNTDVELGAILDNSPPTFISLSLCNVHLVADPKHTSLSNIESLSFNETVLPEGIDTFISQYFPKLSNLKLNKCRVIGSLLNLEKTDLLNFSYITYFVGGRTNISVVTSGNNKRRWYTIRNGNRNFHGVFNDILYDTVYPPVKSRPQNNTDTEPQFTLICNSINNFILM